MKNPTYTRTSVVVFGLLATLAAHAPSADAQIRGSERASVSQTVDGTTMTLTWARPSARGRELFGGLVPWDVVWTPGANWATTFETDEDVVMNGVPVPAGDYSVWMIPRTGRWTLTLNPEPKIYHFQKPDSTDGQIHIEVEPTQVTHTEMLTWSFPAVSGDAARLAMTWGSTRVPVDVMVQPTEPVVLDPAEREVYLGNYALDVLPGIGYPTEATLMVTEEDGMLRAHLPFPIHPGDELTFDLVPAGLHRFSPALYHGDELFNIEMGVAFEFAVDADQAVSVVMRGIEGTPFGQGPRTTATSTQEDGSRR